MGPGGNTYLIEGHYDQCLWREFGESCLKEVLKEISCESNSCAVLIRKGKIE
jgi:hypothetical protein